MAPVSSPAASSSHSDVEEKHLNGDDVYDPDQDPAEKRATRRGLRTIAGEIEGKEGFEEKEKKPLSFLTRFFLL